MSAPVKLYLACWFLGAAVQSAVFFTFNAVDYFNFFFPNNYKPEVYIGVVIGVGASLGATITVLISLRNNLLKVVLIALIASAVILVAEVVVTPQTDLIKQEVRFGSLLALVFVATVIQNIGGGALYNFVGKNFPRFGIHAAQSGGVCAFAATFVVRCISKGSFEKEKNRSKGFRLSGYLFVALVVIIILVACCLAAVLRQLEGDSCQVLNEDDEARPLLLKTKEENLKLSRKQIIKKNWPVFATICLTLVISNSLFPGITSQFHGNYNCSSSLKSLHNLSSHITRDAATPNPPVSSDKTGWFVVILFGCYSVADALGKNLPILGILYNNKTILVNLLLQLTVAVPVLLIYFMPCVSQLQSNWLAFVVVGCLGLVNGYGLCAAMMLLSPGRNKQEEGQATSIGFMFLQVGILIGMSVSIVLVDVVFTKVK